VEGKAQPRTPGRAIALTLGLLATGIALWCQRGVLHELALAAPLPTLACVMAAFGAACTRVFPRLRSLWRRLLRMPAPAFDAALFTAALAAYIVIAHEVFYAVPRLDDGVAALFQARIFARLAVTLPLPPEPGFYEIFGVLGYRANQGHWCGMYPPGWPALLTPGVWVGAPWIVNPVLGALLPVATGRLGRALFDARTGRTAALLTAACPFVYLLSGMHLSHIATALFLVLCLLCLVRLLRTGSLLRGAGAGAAWGAAFLCRPLTALTVGACYGLVALCRPRTVLRRVPALTVLLVFGALFAVIFMSFKYRIVGDPFTQGHEVGMGGRGQYGFVKLDHARTHTPELGLHHTAARIRALNNDLLGWPVAGLLLAAVPLLLARRGRAYALALTPVPALLAVYAGFWYFECYFPARYVTAGIPPLLVAVARGLVLLAALARRRPPVARLFGASVLASLLFAAVVAAPGRTAVFHRSFGDVEGALEPTLERYGITNNAVVFMDALGRAAGEPDPLNSYYATGFMRNDLDLDNTVLFVRNARRQNVKILDLYPGRDLYLYRYLRHQDAGAVFRAIPEDDGLRYELIPPP